jgi:hypothetical protein
MVSYKGFIDDDDDDDNDALKVVAIVACGAMGLPCKTWAVSSFT